MLEVKLINLLLKSDSYYSILNFKRFNSSCIQDKILKNIFVIITKFYRKYKKVISREEFESIVDVLNIDLTKKELLRQTFNTIQHEKKSEQSFEFIVDSLKNTYKYNQIKTVLSIASSDLNTENMDIVMKSVQRGIYNLETETNEEISEGLLSENIDDRKLMYETKKADQGSGMFIGFPTFDIITNGIGKGELIVVMSGTGEGKSVFLLNVGAYIYNVLNKNVLYISIENSREQIERRFDSLSSGVGYDKIKNGSLSTEEEEKYFKFLCAQKLKTNKFYVYDNPVCTIEDIYTKFSEISSVFKPDVVIVDYLGIIKYSRIHTKQTWEQIGDVAFELRKLARIFKIPVITASQVERGAQKNRKEDRYSTIHVAQSILIINHSDIALSLKINNPEILDSSAVCDLTAAIVKNRDGAKGKFTIYANFSEIKMAERVIPDVM